MSRQYEGIYMKGRKFQGVKGVVSERSRLSFPFLPGAFFLGMGLIVLVAPKFFAAVLATVLIFLGCLFCVIAWKFMRIRKNFRHIVELFNGKVEIQAFQIGGQPDNEDPESESKKIIYH